jgi:hypothetical protein
MPLLENTKQREAVELMLLENGMVNGLESIDIELDSET